MAKHHKYDMFISYAHADRTWTRELVDALKKRSASVWFDEHEIPAGKSILPAFEKGLRNSDIVVLVSPTNEARPNVLFELGAAVALGKTVVPIVSADADIRKLPAPLRSKRFLRMEDPNTIASELLVTKRKLHSTKGKRTPSNLKSMKLG